MASDGSLLRPQSELLRPSLSICWSRSATFGLHVAQDRLLGAGCSHIFTASVGKSPGLCFRKHHDSTNASVACTCYPNGPPHWQAPLFRGILGLPFTSADETNTQCVYTACLLPTILGISAEVSHIWRDSRQEDTRGSII
jgi:hypothetical protein